MNYPDRHISWGIGHDIHETDLMSMPSVDDGVPTLPRMLLHERIRRGAVVMALLTLVILACMQARTLLTLTLPHAATPLPQPITSPGPTHAPKAN